ncbi:MAG: hypothetical protein O3A93_14110 [Chloroflexi bacterium]|nr:hypothetical protein [Chloroflexota bacterium]
MEIGRMSGRMEKCWVCKGKTSTENSRRHLYPTGVNQYYELCEKCAAGRKYEPLEGLSWFGVGNVAHWAWDRGERNANNLWLYPIVVVLTGVMLVAGFMAMYGAFYGLKWLLFSGG